MNAKYSIVNMSTWIFFALFLALVSAQNIKVLKECADENLKALNRYRASMGLNSLSMNSEARRRAEDHTKIMASRDSLDHSESSVYMDAENIAQNSMMDSETPADMGDKFFKQWRESSGHNRNMLRDSMKYIGIACVGRPGGYYESVYATQIFWRQAYGGSTESPEEPVTVSPPTKPKEQPEMPKEQPEMPKGQPEMPKEQPEMPKEQPEMPKGQPEMPKEQPEMPKGQPEMPKDEPDRRSPKYMGDNKYGYGQDKDCSFSKNDESMSSGNDAMMSPDGTDMDTGSADEMEEKKDGRRRRRRYWRRSPKETEMPQAMPSGMPDENENRPFWYTWWAHDGNSDSGVKKSDSDSSDGDDNGHRGFFSWF